MKRYLLIMSFLMLGCAGVFGQSITLNDLTTVSNLSNTEAHNYLVQNKKFKQQYLQDVDGFTIEHLHRVTEGNKEETVVIGVGKKLDNGTLLRTVTYTAVDQQNILNLMNQAKHQGGLKLKFKGADVKNDIYIFDNDYYHIVIFFNHDKTSGSVEVHQKEFLGFD